MTLNVDVYIKNDGKTFNTYIGVASPFYLYKKSHNYSLIKIIIFNIFKGECQNIDKLIIVDFFILDIKFNYNIFRHN